MKKIIAFCLFFIFSGSFYAQDSKTKSEPVKKETTKKKSGYDYDKDVPVKSTKKEANSKSSATKETAKKETTKKESVSVGDDKAVGKDDKGRTIYEGPRGGKYYINPNGNKTYLKPDKD